MNFFKLGVSTLLCLSTLMETQSHAEVSQQQIDDTIEAIQEALVDAVANGQWTGKYEGHDENHVGTSAICVEALLLSGYPYQMQIIQDAIAFQRAEIPESPYSASMRAHMWSILPDAYLPELELEMSRMRASVNPTGCSWGKYSIPEGYENVTSVTYDPTAGGRHDYSMSQYGVLALWQGRKRGLDVDADFWPAVIDLAISHQKDDGSWGYTPSAESTLKMTCAGLTMLYVARMERDRHLDIRDQRVEDAIQKGLDWLDENYTTAVDGYHKELLGYQYYGFERVGLASGLSTFGGVDWYQSMATVICDKYPSKSNNHVDNAFCLKFLMRGGAPLWCQKLQIEGYDWNNRPNDIYYLTLNLEEYREAETNWQVTNINIPSEQWMNTPLTYLSIRNDLEITDTQLENLRNYILNGGLLCINPEGSSGANAAEDFCNKLFPDLSLQDVGPDDILAEGFTSTSITGETITKAPFRTLNSGGRHLVVVMTNDMGMEFQKDDTFDPNESHNQVGINLYNLATARGETTPRTFNPYLTLGEPATTGIEVFIAQPECEGFVEEHAWQLQSQYMKETCGETIVSSTGKIQDIVGKAPALVHIIGSNTSNKPLSAGELSTLVGYIKDGGTVFVETAGGTGSFASRVTEQLADALDSQAKPMPDLHSVISGSDLGYSGTAQTESICVPAAWRSITVVSAPPGSNITSPILQHIEYEGRSGVISSNYDITLAAINCRQYGPTGYQARTAHALLMNIATYASKD